MTAAEAGVYRCRYGVSRTVREPGKRKRIETRSAFVDVPENATDDEVRRAVRADAAERFPGYSLSGHSLPPERE